MVKSKYRINKIEEDTTQLAFYVIAFSSGAGIQSILLPAYKNYALLDSCRQKSGILTSSQSLICLSVASGLRMYQMRDLQASSSN